VLDELQSLTEQKADAAAGKLVFVKHARSVICTRARAKDRARLDRHGRASERELLVHLIDPNRSVEGNFRVYMVVTDDGRVLTGLRANRNGD
jgi:hypothetical protein